MATEPEFESSSARPWLPADAEPTDDRGQSGDPTDGPDPRSGIVWPADGTVPMEPASDAEPEPRPSLGERWPAQVIAAPEGWTDPPTSADGPRLWDRVLLAEAARATRYERPVTVAFAEVGGLDDIAVEHGADAAHRLLAACARQMGREIRASDHFARLDRTTFGILLPETSEIEAINVLERVRTACEAELAVVDGELTIAIGWASRADNGELGDAVAVARTRLAAEHADRPPA